VIVIETSAMVNALVGDPPNPQLLATLADEELHAPALLDLEVASVLRGHVLAGKLDSARLDEALDDFASLHIERYLMTDLLGYMLDIRDNFTVYDAAYLVLADALQVPVLTADDKLAEARRLGIEVRMVEPG
jgi:predicted nucleic acid-binding protein